MVNSSIDFSNPHVERIVLHLCIRDYEAFSEVMTQLSLDDFFIPHHKVLYSLMLFMSDAGIQNFDFHTVVAKSETFGGLDALGGQSYLSAIYDMSASKENLSSLINDLIDRSQKRKLYNVVVKTEQQIAKNNDTKDPKSFDYFASCLEKEISSLEVEKDRVGDPSPLFDGVEDLLQECQNRESGLVGFSSGFPLLDKYTRGFCNGNLYVLAARPKTGKSMLLMNWALNLSMQGLPILYLDTEMTRSEVQSRALARLSGVPEEIIITGDFANDSQAFNSVMEAKDIISGLEYDHKYTPKFKPHELERLAKKYKLKKNIQALFFDYIKMPEVNEGVSETQYLGVLTSTLKDLAGVLDIPVITAVQLGRVAEGKSKVSSGMIGESDRILRYCNVMMGLVAKTMDEINESGGEDLCGTHRLQILDNRSGRNFYSGIDLNYNYHVSEITQADAQSADSIIEQADSYF